MPAIKTPKNRALPPHPTSSWKLSNAIPEGVGFSEIKLQAGYGDKKLRNILFRLHKLGKIKRISRGVYAKA